MGNPFNIGPFNCCSCPEPPDFDAETDTAMAKYINMCGCPTVAIVCVSENKTATLIGFSEYTASEITASTPPLKYRKKTKNYSQALRNYSCLCSTKTLVFRSVYTWEATSIYDAVTGVVVDSLPSFPGSESWVYSTSGSGEDCEITLESSSVGSGGFGNVSDFGTVTSTTERSGSTTNNGDFFGPSDCANPQNNFTSETSLVLSTLDTDGDALTRATETTGSLCSSINQLRTTSFSWTERTVTYTATAENLVIGVAYEGCVRIQRREAYSGTEPDDADTAWEDVEPDTIASFTPTETSEVVATDEALPFVKGWEYEVVSAHVWPVSAGCDCPTSYVAP